MIQAYVQARDFFSLNYLNNTGHDKNDPVGCSSDSAGHCFAVRTGSGGTVSVYPCLPLPGRGHLL